MITLNLSTRRAMSLLAELQIHVPQVCQHQIRAVRRKLFFALKSKLNTTKVGKQFLSDAAEHEYAIEKGIL